MSQPAVDQDWRTHVPRTRPFTSVLMCPPEHFEVIDEKNAFMTGQVGAVNRARAGKQWQALADAYRSLGVTVHVLPAARGREDMVFTANPALVLPATQASDANSGAEPAASVVMSRMNHESRQAEVAPLQAWLRRAGLEPLSLPAGCGHLEGHGDVLVVPGRRLLLGGFGGRSDPAALAAAAELLDAPLVPLALRGQPFYHLDTCLAVLDENTLLLHPPAFHAEALTTLAALFPRCIEADAAEASAQFACNAHALRDGHVLVPAGARRTAAALRAAGYRPVPVDVSEFHKSGGSIFCLKLELPDLPAA